LDLGHGITQGRVRRASTGDNIMMNGMGIGMAFGWVVGFLVLVFLVLAIAALIKYLRQ
jgi:hypothetical protein